MTVIVTKNSSTASAVPTTSDLVQGELAVNVTDKRIFTENASTQIVELGTNPSTVTTGTATVTGTLTANGTFASNNAVITGGSVNSTPIGATTASTVRGTTVTATTGFVGGLTGNVVGNLTGNVTGNVTGNLTGNVTGNVTASSGTTTLNDLVVNGTADFTNTKLTNITTPTADSDAANKGYVDATVAAVIDSAPAALDTLNELAAALGDDANFSATVTTALATKLPLAGGTMTGAIAMGTSKITGLGDPTASQDAATKTYVDTADALKLNLTGGTMSGAIAMGTNKVTGVGDPTNAQDAATKAYTDSILGSATSAADSAAAAATSESNAATSASNASTSETNALNSANAAASSYDQFDDRYLGDKASNPTLDNDGNALLTGALYFNTTTDVMRVYTGSAWQDVAISTNSPTFTGTVTADGLSLGDNDKATFGAGNDLEIYHDGTDSFIKETGAGSLKIWAKDFEVYNAGGTETLINADVNAGVQLYFDNAIKLATTTTGIDVTGTATMDGLTVDGTDTEAVSSQLLKVRNSTTGEAATIGLYATADNGGDGNSGSITFDAGANGVASNNQLRFSADHQTDTNPALSIAGTGDISFYEDTGTTPKFFWDASAERLGVGTSSPAQMLHLSGTVPDIQYTDTTGSEYRLGNNNGAFRLYDVTASTERMRIDSSGNVGIGTSSPSSDLHVANTDSFAVIAIQAANTQTSHIFFGDTDDTDVGRISYQHSDNSMLFRVNASEAMRIDSSGNVGIGTTTPSGKLDIQFADNTAWSSSARADGYLQIHNTSTTAGTYSGIELLATGTGSAGAAEIVCIDSGSGNGDLAFSTRSIGTWGEKLRITSTGNVGIGTASPDYKLEVEEAGTGSGLGGIAAATTTAGGSAGYRWVSGGTPRFAMTIIGSAGSEGLRIYDNNNASERMRIDSLGNASFNTTSTSPSANNVFGTAILQYGGASMSRTNSTTLDLNRSTSDGAIIQFRKDGTAVGSIGTVSGDLNIYANEAGHKGLRLGAGFVAPTSNSTSVEDATTDLGVATARFRNLYLSGTANVGVGRFTAQNTAHSAATLVLGHEGSSKSQIRSYGIDTGTVGSLEFMVSASDGTGDKRMTLDSSGNLLIGDSSTDITSKLTVSGNGSANTATFMYDGSSGTYLDIDTEIANGAVILRADARSGAYPPLLFKVGGSERVRIDTSGNLLVGTTNPDVSFGATTGSSLQSSGQTHHSSSGTSLVLNRTASDGVIAQFRRSGITVGTIGVHTASSANAYIGSGDVGVYFDSINNRVSPYDVGASAISNGAIALGGSSTRFKDLYLSGGVYLGGTGAANKLDDYEEGTWTPVADFSTTSPSSGASNGVGRYVKIGNTVTVWATFTNINVTGAVGNINITGLPFTAKLNAAQILYAGTIRVSSVNIANSYLSSEVRDGESYIRIMEAINGADAAELTAGDFNDNSSDFFITLTYETA